MKKALTHIAAFSVLLLPLVVLAQTNQIGLQNPIKVNSISELILIVTRVVRFILIPFLVLAIMWAGFQYLLAQINASGYKIADANKTLKYTLIGGFILLSAELIALVMKNTIEGLAK